MSALMENSHSIEITEMSESGLEFLFIYIMSRVSRWLDR